MSIQRWDIYTDFAGSLYEDKHPTGKWVTHDDHVAEVERLRADPRLALDWSHLLWAADHNEQELELDKERRAAGRLNERDHEWRKELAAVFRDALAGEGGER